MPKAKKYVDLGNDYLFNLRMYKEAEESYEKAIKIDPLNFEANFNLGIARHCLMWQMPKENQ